MGTVEIRNDLSIKQFDSVAEGDLNRTPYLSATDQVNNLNLISFLKERGLSVLPFDQLTVDLDDETLERILLDDQQFGNRQ